MKRRVNGRSSLDLDSARKRREGADWDLGAEQAHSLTTTVAVASRWQRLYGWCLSISECLVVGSFVLTFMV
jgi:hypothetical protein